ncbi:DUF3857 domain-containing protein [Myroides sp. DW712]|uniref:DUF3857 domain-containing protein n=1 Tax=Myroides sp. DW712 TaxID=3389800 RepID=UPI00397C10D2
MKKCIVLFLLLVSSAVVQGQSFLGKVTLEELTQEKDSLYPEADTSILNEEGLVYFEYFPEIGFKMNQVVSRKIKVYTKDGISSIDLSVPYYIGNGVTELVKINDVITYNEKNGKIERSKIKSNAIFDDKKNENWKIKKVIIPDVKEGSIIEYTYTVVSDYFNIIPAWNFQRSIPIHKSTYEVRIPEFLVYTTRVKGGIKINKINNVETKAIRLTNTYPYKEVRMKESVHKYTVTDVLPLREEPYLDNIDNYRASIQFDLSMINYPNQRPRVIALSESDLIKSIYEGNGFKDQLKQTKYFEKVINLQDYEGLTEEEKTQKVLALVKNSVSWNEKFGYLTRDGVKKAFEQKTGNVAEINLMLTSMLRYVGLKSNPILVSTVNNGIDLSFQKTTFNTVLSSVEINQATLLLDATEKYTDINIVPPHNLNWEGILIKDNGQFFKVNMIPNFHSVSSESFVFNLSEDETSEAGSGQAMFTYKDYIAYFARTKRQGQSEEQISNELEKTYKNMDVKGIRIYGQDDLSRAYSMRFSFDKANAVSRIGNEIYFNPMQFFGLDANPFQAEERVMPISFRLPYVDVYKLTLTIPPSYTIEYLPENMDLFDQATGLKAFYSVEEVEGKIVCSFECSKSLVHVEASDYKKVKQFYDKILEKIEEQVILKKN